jgi:hypothetical protein
MTNIGPQQLPNFDFDADHPSYDFDVGVDPDPAFHSDADPVWDQASQNDVFHAHPNPQKCLLYEFSSSQLSCFYRCFFCLLCYLLADIFKAIVHQLFHQL